MSKESYARGFCKAAEAAGVDPRALAKFASLGDIVNAGMSTMAGGSALAPRMFVPGTDKVKPSKEIEGENARSALPALLSWHLLKEPFRLSSSMLNNFLLTGGGPEYRRRIDYDGAKDAKPMIEMFARAGLKPDPPQIQETADELARKHPEFASGTGLIQTAKK